MSQAPIMPFFTDAYLADCHHLSAQEHGANLLILLHTWRRGGEPLPDDDGLMMRVTKTGTLRQWQKVRLSLLPLYDVSGGTWRQKKLEATWAEVMRKIEANTANGKRAAASKKKDANPVDFQDAGTANAPDWLQQSINHKP